MLIKPEDKTIKGVLEGGYYRIPRFQRPYSWDKDNVDDFWSDVVSSDSAEYFIGSFVLYKKKGDSDTYFVVDGQQRLTTVVLFLAALRNAFDSLGMKTLAKGIQKRIEREDIEDEKHFVLDSETPYPFLQEFILKHGKPELKKKRGREEEALETAFQYLDAKIASALAAIDTDASVIGKNKAKAKQKKLEEIRDALLALQLITVELDNEDDAYLVFETLNTRGKDLGVADLVKNLLTRLIKNKNKSVDVSKDKWTGLRQELESSNAELDINA